SVAFGDRGRLVLWRVSAPQDPNGYSYGDCGKHALGAIGKVLGKRVVYNGGAVGQSATVCIDRNTAVSVWNQYSVNAATLKRIAASAVTVG
ncbi:MAG TPA: hypothetical protein VGU02_11390, partial [Gaiellaceae bacterium]|nr:hypothetical protein [Gaiellaceae bacterium]